MKAHTTSHLSRRERQIMDAIYARNEATAAQVHAALPDAPSYSAIRALLRILEDKGHLQHRCEKGKYIYMPRQTRTAAGKSALQRLVETFLDSSAAKAVAALLATSDAALSDQQLDEISAMITQARARRKRHERQ